MRDNTIGVFVDIISIHKNTKRLYNSKLDYKAYLERIGEEGRICRAYAYGAQINDEARKFIGFLKMAGFDVKYCQAKDDVIYPEKVLKTIEKVFSLDSDDRVFEYLKSKVNMTEPVVTPSVQQTDRTMDMIMDILRNIDRLEVVVLGSSNPRLTPLVKYLKEEGIKVIVFSCSIPRALRQEADLAWDINESFLEKGKEIIEEPVEEEVEV